jgi:hypothetical protein
MLNVNLQDGKGRANLAKVNGEGELSVVVHPHPPKEEDQNALPFRQYFTDDGTTAGSNDMCVNGSTNEVLFWIEAVPKNDIYIKYISVEISDNGSPNLNGFGALSALTNGVKWTWFNQEEGDYELHEGIKTNKEFVARVGTDTAAVGTGVDAFLSDVGGGGGTAKSYFPAIDISENYGLPWGLRLRKGTTDKIIFTVRDNLTSLVTFNAVAYGIRF